MFDRHERQWLCGLLGLPVDCAATRGELVRWAREAGHVVPDPPRRAPEPCDPLCPSWGVFDCERCAVHDDDCPCERDDCSSLMIDECIDCWHGVPDAPGPEYYQGHPVCIAVLAADRAREREPRDDAPDCNCGECYPGPYTCIRDD